MTARVDQLCDMAKAVIRTAAAARPLYWDGQATTITVTCDDVPDIDGDDLPTGTLYVVIWADGYSDGGPLARDTDARDYRLRFLVVEKCPDAGRVPNEWRRERSAWVDEVIVNALSDARDELDGAYALTLDDVTFDQEELLERWLFWTVVSITFRDEREVC